MTDSRMTELQSLSKLKKAGRLHYWRRTIEMSESELHAICDEIQAEHDQAITATLKGGTCCLHYGEDDDGYDGWYCDECGGWFQAARRDGHLVEPKHCQECGKAVER